MAPVLPPPDPDRWPGSPDNGGPPYDDDVNARVSALEARLDTILPTLATKADIAEVRTDIQKGTAEIHKWMLATVLAIVGTMLAALFGLNQISRQQAPAAAQPPIIINVPAAAAPAAAPPASQRR